MAATATAAPTRQRPQLRTIQGVVASDKGNKTIKVIVEYQMRHPKYGKYLKRRTVLHAHDEKNDAREGDTVELAECRPLSKTKHHRLLRIVRSSARGGLPWGVPPRSLLGLAGFAGFVVVCCFAMVITLR